MTDSVLPLRPMFRNLTGCRFGKLAVISFDGMIPSKTRRHSVWKCQCDCGKKTSIKSSSLINGHTSSCGCLQIEKATRHSLSKTPEYKAWVNMKNRCYDKGNRKYSDYGGRGIVVCETWKESFLAFLADVGPRPSKNHSIDRFPNMNGNYEPGNVRWATDYEQNRNRRCNHLIEYNGVTRCLGEWASIFKINPRTLYGRLQRMDVIRALTMPVKKRSRKT